MAPRRRCTVIAATPRTSVVIPAYHAEATLGRVLAALEPQLEHGRREVIIVDSTGDGTVERLGREWPWVRVVALRARTLPGRARNLGVRAARGELLAFLDADAVPEPDWLDELERALGPEVDMVGGAVLNGTPGSAWGTTSHLLEFLDWLPDRDRQVPHAVTANLLVPSDVFERAGGFREDLWPGEDTLFTFVAGAAGRLGFAPSSRVVHLNRTERLQVLRHQRRLGESFVAVCATAPLGGHRLARPWLAPVAVLARAHWLLIRARADPALRAEMMRHAPRLIAGLAAWGVGVAGSGSGRRAASGL